MLLNPIKTTRTIDFDNPNSDSSEELEEREQAEAFKILCKLGSKTLRSFAKSGDVENGRQPIHMAAVFGQTEILSFLLGKGVAVDLEDEFGTQPIHLAVLAAGINGYERE